MLQIEAEGDFIMSEAKAVDPGVCLGFGGTNARMAVCAEGDVIDFESIPTPTEPAPFFEWMARKVLDAADSGNSWVVAGFPGPVSPDGRLIGPFENVSGMAKEQYDLRAQLTTADSEVEKILEQGFILLPVNDGTLAAQAAASRIGEHKYEKTGALIFGTGVGAGVVVKDARYTNLHRADTTNPLEIGHLLLGAYPNDTFETRYSGPAMERLYGSKPEDLPTEHPAWIAEGIAVGRLVTTLGLMNRVELVVPTGGIGIGASDKHGPWLKKFLEDYARSGNGPQRAFTPKVVLVPPSDCDVFEMYGAEGVMRDHLTQPE